MSDISSFFEIKIEEILQEKIKTKPNKIAVALSGGSDSLALTLLLDEICRAKNISLIAVTLDHKMRENSTKELEELSKILVSKKIPHHILQISEDKIPQKNIEAKLREIRYEMLHDFCQENKIELLFLGHIVGDIAENFLIRLFRGSGLDGLSSIAEISDYKNIKLVRPLLDCSKDDLQQYLIERKIEWFEDETNVDERFLRNKMRNFFDSFEEKNLIHKRIKSASDEISKIRDFFDDVLLQKAKDILIIQENGDGFVFLINHKKFKDLDEKFALKILALVLMEVGGNDYKPRLEKLKNFYQHLLQDKIKPRNFYNSVASQYDKKHILISVENQKNNSVVALKTILKELY